MKWSLWIAAGLAAALVVSPAAAQQKNFDLESVPKQIEDQLYCLSDPLLDSDDYYEIEDVVFATDLSAEDAQARIRKALDPYAAVCERVHAWPDERSRFAREFTLYATVADLLYDRLVDSEVSSSTLDRIYGQIDFMPKEELVPFSAETWRDDAGFRQTMEVRLKGLGVPAESEIMSLALEFMAWEIRAGFAAVGFVNTFAR